MVSGFLAACAGLTFCAAITTLIQRMGRIVEVNMAYFKGRKSRQDRDNVCFMGNGTGQPTGQRSTARRPVSIRSAHYSY